MHIACNLSETVQTATEITNYIAFKIVAPIYIIVGICLRGICLVVFYKQYKKEKAYNYQVFATFCELLRMFTCLSSTLTMNNLAGFRQVGSVWFQKSYVSMWYSARVAASLDQGFITVTLFAYLSMTADRLYALAKPFSYKAIDHKRHQTIAAFLCLFLGVSTSIFDTFRYDMREAGDHYVIVVNDEYVESTVGIVFSTIRNVVRMTGDVALIACNVAMVLSYRKSTRRINVASTNEHRQDKRKEIERTLLYLTFCQSVVTTVSMTLWNVYYGMVYSYRDFTECEGMLMAAIVDIITQMGDVVQFIAIWAVSKQLRESILGLVRCKTITDS